MYQPKRYQKKDAEYFKEFIAAHPFATLVIQGERLLATHIPVLLDDLKPEITLFGHIANFNVQLKYLKENVEVLLIFQGANGYVSSSWYKEKDISTWDYSAVHVNAKIRLQTSSELESSLEKLVNHFEKKQENPLYYSEIPTAMLKEHLPLITGFWCAPFKIEGVAKLHQGYTKEDVQSSIEHLSKCPSTTQLSEDIKNEHDRSNT
ncbi:MAG: FMN-binding negative transcriptional regulator [Leeuwenhoekiella sp.]